MISFSKTTVAALAFGLAALTACSPPAPKAPEPAAPAAAATPPGSTPAKTWTAEGDSAQITGKLERIEVSDKATFKTEKGHVIETEVIGTANPDATISVDRTEKRLADVAGLAGGATAMTYKVVSETSPGPDAPNLCGLKPATALVLVDVDGTGASRLVAVTGDMPGSPGASVCQTLSYTRAG
jgi:hypothetical protein